jgi:hypothetical protein
MPSRELSKWAKEEIVGAINEMMEVKRAFGDQGMPLDADELEALSRERDRVFKFLNLGPKK